MSRTPLRTKSLTLQAATWAVFTWTPTTLITLARLALRHSRPRSAWTGASRSPPPTSTPDWAGVITVGATTPSLPRSTEFKSTVATGRVRAIPTSPAEASITKMFMKDVSFSQKAQRLIIQYTVHVNYAREGLMTEALL